MSADWKDQLKHVYKNLQQDQKNKKGFQSKFDKVRGYKNKLGFNDTGVPLTARAAKQLQVLGKNLKLDSARHCQLWQCILRANSKV